MTGAKIVVGQVEIGRPSVFGVDKTAPANAAVKLPGVFDIDQFSLPDEFVDSHAANVASVIVSQDKMLRGVAPDALLYSAASGFETSGQQEECLASQHLASRNSGDLRAINFSFGEPLIQDEREEPLLDGNALLTLCIDWSGQLPDFHPVNVLEIPTVTPVQIAMQ